MKKDEVPPAPGPPRGEGDKAQTAWPRQEDAPSPSEGAGTAGSASNFGSSLSDSFRKVLVGGASALLGTEENIRSALGDVRHPKEAVNFLLQQTERTRKEVSRVVSKEVKRALDRVDLRGELRRALVGLTVDVRASVHFREDARPSRLRVRHKTRRQRAANGPDGHDKATASQDGGQPKQNSSKVPQT